MNRCPRCKINIYDDTNVCPFCHRVLDEVEDEKEISERFRGGASYPDIWTKQKRMRFALRLVLFLFIVAEICLVTVNLLVTPKYLWCILTGVVFVYSYAFLLYWIRHDAGFASKIGMQMFLTIVILYAIDHFSGDHGWALQWAIPGILLGGDAIVFFLMMLNRSRWVSYTLLLLMIGISSVAIIALYFAGKISNIVLPVICVSVTGIFILGTAIFGSREFVREIKRRFHV